VGSALPKQFTALGDKPLISWSLDVLERVGCSPVIVVAPADLLEQARALVSHSATSVVVTGGESRHASVARGLDEVRAERVVVHDAARPFVTEPEVRAVLAALEGAPGALTAQPVDDTLKRVEEGRVVETVDRAGLWRAQTPQAFRTAELRDAHRRAAAESFEATDDTALLERYGRKVVVVEGSPRNFKVTSPQQLELAQELAGRRR